MRIRLQICLAMAAGLFATCGMSADAGVAGNIYAGTVTLVTPDGSTVPFDWTVSFREDKSLELIAEGIPQAGTYQEIDLGVISFYRAGIDNEFQSRFTGICLMSKLNILKSFTDTDGNTLGSGVLRLVSPGEGQRSRH